MGEDGELEETGVPAARSQPGLVATALCLPVPLTSRYVPVLYGRDPWEMGNSG